MPSAHTPSTAIELFDPVDQVALDAVVRHALIGSGMSEWARHKVQWRARKERGELIVELLRVESQTILARAVVIAEARRDQAREQAAVATFREQLRCGLDALRARDAAIANAQRLSEDSREIGVGLVDRLTAAYTEKLEDRAGRLR